MTVNLFHCQVCVKQPKWDEKKMELKNLLATELEPLDVHIQDKIHDYATENVALEECAGCKLIYYCGEDHRQQDHSRHGPDCQPDKMKQLLHDEFILLQLMHEPRLKYFEKVKDQIF